MGEGSLLMKNFMQLETVVQNEIDLTVFDNPHIEVVWEDLSQNFTEERLKRVKSYFQKKYKTKHVSIKPIAIIDKNADTKLKTLEMSDSILDPQYQKKIVKEYMQQNGITIAWDMINRLDDKVNAENQKESTLQVRYNKWVLKKIKFSNFLSFGPDNVIDYRDLDGITVVESEPKNFGGKTVVSIDLIMFLLFNTTTKSKTAEEIFNQFLPDNHEVNVRGYLEIDNTPYMIERKITRKQKKNTEWDVKTELTFFKKNDRDEYENLSGEQRRKTETYIQNAIGDKEDFLLTILSTANNLEDLLDAKATARGQLLVKFLGLDSLRKKEEICKEFYNEWSKKLVSNLHDVTTLEAKMDELKQAIGETREKILKLESIHDEDEKSLKELNLEKEGLLVRQHRDIDQELAKINPALFKQEIVDSEKKVTEMFERYETFEVKEPSQYYRETEHTLVQQEVNNLKIQGQITGTEIEKLFSQIKDLQEGNVCPTCKRVMDNCDHSAEIAELEQKIHTASELLKRLESDLFVKEQELLKYQQLQKEFQDYDRNKLIKEKYLIELQQKELELQNKKEKFTRWELNKSRLEENLEIERELIRVRTVIETKTTEINNCRVQIQNLRKDIEIKEKTILDNLEFIKKIKKEEEYQKVFQTYLNIYGKNGISKSILKNMIPLINQELNRILSDSCSFSLVININEKNEVEFVMVDNETRVEKPMMSGSGYERTVASLALRAVLSKISTLPKPNIIVMDEIFGKVADDNLPMVGEFFLKIKDYFEHILIITHNPLVKNWTNNVITIRKENNISYIAP